MIFTGLFSMALLKIKTKERAAIVSFFTAIKDSMFVLIDWIMMLAPVGIFALVFPLAATLGVSAISVLGSFLFLVSSFIVVVHAGTVSPGCLYWPHPPARLYSRSRTSADCWLQSTLLAGSASG